MLWPTAKRSLIVSIVVIGCGLAVGGWQVEEHLRFKHSAEQALINRGRDITSTLGVLLHSQRRQFGIVSKERLESALDELVKPEEIESVAILGGTGESIASAGNKMEVTPEMLQAKGVFWRGDTVTIMNPVDLDAPTTEDGPRGRPPIVVSDERARALRPPSNRRGGEARPNSNTNPATSTTTPAAPGTAAPPASTPTVSGEVPNPAGTDAPAAPAASATPAPPAARPRFAFGRPPWIKPEDFDALIQSQGAQSLVLSLSTVEMQRRINADLLLRSLVSLLAMGGAIVSTMAWRNMGKNTELQIRLVKAGETNTHLKEMNFAAAGLAHETRNPLNLIRGFAQMISMQPEASPKLKEQASTIIEEADRVTVQLNEFINYSKPREAHLAPVEVQRLVADVARTLVPDIEEKQIQLVQPESPLVVAADEQLLRQALFNLLLNAVQSVESGGQIAIRLSSTDDREATLEVSDDGPGVPPAERQNIFKPYMTMRPGGVGLGLAIVQQIVSAHHWEITCDANEPHGALFRLRHLKIAAPAA